MSNCSCQPACFTPPDGFPAGLFTLLPWSVETIYDLRNLSQNLAAYTVVEVLGYNAKGDGGGGMFWYDPTSTDTPDGGTIFEPYAPIGGRWFRQSTSNPTNVRWFGATGDGTTDDTSAFVAAVAYFAGRGGALYCPAGNYSIDTITLTAGVNLYGDGVDNTVLTQRNVTGPSYGTLYADTLDNTDGVYIEGLRIADLTLNGRVGTIGFSQFRHLVSWNGVKNGVIERVKFLGFCGDGLYLGSGLSGGVTVRHNYDITVRDCVFDGVNKNNRNAISIIDGVKVTVENCLFTRCTKAGMPGAIDIEPDPMPTTRLQDITVFNNKFVDVGVAGASAVGVGLILPTYAQTDLTLPVKNIQIVGNRFSGIDRGVQMVMKWNAASSSADILVAQNVFQPNVELGAYAMSFSNLKGITALQNSTTFCSNPIAFQNTCVDVVYQGNFHFQAEIAIESLTNGVFSDNIFKHQSGPYPSVFTFRATNDSAPPTPAVSTNTAIINNTVIQNGASPWTYITYAVGHTFSTYTNLFLNNRYDASMQSQMLPYCVSWMNDINILRSGGKLIFNGGGVNRPAELVESHQDGNNTGMQLWGGVGGVLQKLIDARGEYAERIIELFGKVRVTNGGLNYPAYFVDEHQDGNNTGIATYVGVGGSYAKITEAYGLYGDPKFNINARLLHTGTHLGFYNASEVTKPIVTGSKGGNAALTSLIAALASLGLITDSTS